MIPELETALLQFAVTFKIQVLGDPRMILIGSQNLPAREISEDYEKLESDAFRSQNRIAEMMQQVNMMAIIDLFTEKMLQNIVYTNGGTEDGKQIIDFTLESFDLFVSSPNSCRLLCKSQTVRQLIENHVVRLKFCQ